MSTNPKISEIEIVVVEDANASEPGVSNAAAPVPGGFKIFNRVLDWITSDRTQLINITDRINEIVRKSGVRDGIVQSAICWQYNHRRLSPPSIWTRCCRTSSASSKTSWRASSIGATTIRRTPIASARTRIRTCVEC